MPVLVLLALQVLLVLLALQVLLVLLALQVLLVLLALLAHRYYSDNWHYRYYWYYLAFTRFCWRGLGGEEGERGLGGKVRARTELIMIAG